jgi:hypothetical protein
MSGTQHMSITTQRLVEHSKLKQFPLMHSRLTLEMCSTSRCLVTDICRVLLMLEVVTRVLLLLDIYFIAGTPFEDGACE